MSEGPCLSYSISSEGQAIPIFRDVKVENAALGAIILQDMNRSAMSRPSSLQCTHTRFVPLYKLQIDWSVDTLSPHLYGNGGSFEIADATADLRKSIVNAKKEKMHQIAELRAKSEATCMEYHKEYGQHLSLRSQVDSSRTAGGPHQRGSCVDHRPGWIPIYLNTPPCSEVP